MMDWGPNAGMGSGGGGFATPFAAQSGFGGGAQASPPSGPGQMGTGGGTGTPPPGTPGAPGQPGSTPAGGVPNNPFYGNLGAYAPAPYQAFGAIPQVNPSLIQGGDIYSQLGPYAQAVEAAMGPQFQQQSDALNSDLASRGIFNSGAANASQGNLLAQQFGEVLQGSLPYAQQNLQGNQNATNQALAGNAAAYGNVTQGNEALYNQYLQNLMGGAMGYGGGLQSGYLGTYGGPNAGAIGILGQGASNAGSAYENAYNQGIAGSGPLGQAFGTMFSGWGQPSSGVNAGATAQPFGQ